MLASSTDLPPDSARSLAYAAEAWRMEEEGSGGGPPAAVPYRLPPVGAYVGPARTTTSRGAAEPMDVDLSE
eukprot:3762537-Heterocapsa_arctica.AAC.1